MTHLSSVFRYISKFRHAGHQVGRKVGDMLEVLTYAALSRDQDLAKRLQIEPRLYGFTDAGHKVEFAILKKPTPKLVKGGELDDPSELIGFIECKKVGVEQTIDSSFKKKYKEQEYLFRKGDVLSTSLGKRSIGKKYTFDVVFGITAKKPTITVFYTVEGERTQALQANIATGYRIIFALTSDGEVAILDDNASLRDIDANVQLEKCKILEFLHVRDDGTAKVLLNDCLTGPQTPEKAKQAAFVALDVRKLRFDQFDRRDNEKELVCALVLTEFSHWEQKSQNVVKACLDKVLIVDDDIIVEAFEKFEEKFEKSFYDFIAKDHFEMNDEVRRIAFEVVNSRDGYIFEDLQDRKLKRFEISGGALTLSASPEKKAIQRKLVA